MPAVPFIIAGAAIVGAGAMVVQTIEAGKAAKDARRANKYERQKSDLQSARQKIEALRAGRQAMAQAQQNSENQGAGGSSIGQGGAGSIYSQTAGNLSFLDQYGYFSDQAGAALQKSADHQAAGQMWGAVGSIAGSVSSAAGKFG